MAVFNNTYVIWLKCTIMHTVLFRHVHIQVRQVYFLIALNKSLSWTWIPWIRLISPIMNRVHYISIRNFLYEDFIHSRKHVCLSTEDAYSFGHLVLSHFRLVMSTDLLSFERPSVLLFCLPELRLYYLSYDPVILKRTIIPVVWPCTALNISFLERCTLTRRWGIYNETRQKPLWRRQGHDPYTLWSLVETPSALRPDIAYSLGSSGCH